MAFELVLAPFTQYKLGLGILRNYRISCDCATEPRLQTSTKKKFFLFNKLPSTFKYNPGEPLVSTTTTLIGSSLGEAASKASLKPH